MSLWYSPLSKDRKTPLVDISLEGITLKEVKRALEVARKEQNQQTTKWGPSYVMRLDGSWRRIDSKPMYGFYTNKV
jgi:hypothetical protein